MFLYNISLLAAPIIILILIIAIQRTHFLIVLLTLEAITLLITAYVAIASSIASNNSPFLIMFLLTIGATEAGLGLGLLVAITRFAGNDIIASLSTLKC